MMNLKNVPGYHEEVGEAVMVLIAVLLVSEL
jgi:hypothetical protein